MAVNLYAPRNVLGTAFFYGATGAALVGAAIFGGPWILGAGVLFAGGLTALEFKPQKDLMENGLVQYPNSPPYAPNLGKFAEELYKVSGLKAEHHPIYDFAPDDKKIGDTGVFATVFRELQKRVAQTYNAASTNFGRPVIMISKPLLQILNDGEEKAVLAHEFAHAAARHNKLGMPLQVAAGIASTTASITRVVAALSTGWRGVLSSVAARTAAAVGYTLLRKDSLLRKHEDDMTLGELARKKKIDKVYNGIGAVVGTAVYTAFSHAYLGIYLGTKAISLAAGGLSKAFSRSMEYQADRGAVKFGANPLDLITGLRKIELVMKNSVEEAYGGHLPKKGFLTRQWENLEADHPTTGRRVQRLAKMALKQGFTQEQVDEAVTGKIEVPETFNLPKKFLLGMARGH